jgi:hypothetical protein
MTNPPDGVQGAPPKLRSRRTFVVVTIGLAALLFVATEGLLYYRWVTMTEPTCMLIIDTAEPLRGWELVVDGLMLPTPHKVTIGTDDRFMLPFYLHPGEYTFKLQREGEVLYEGQVALTPREPGRRVDLSKFRPPPTTSAATQRSAS